MSNLQKIAREPERVSVVKTGANLGNNIFGGHDMERKQTIYDLAVRVCRTVRGVRSDRQAWIGLDLVHRELGSVSPFAVDAAVAFAAAKGWLAIGGGRPSHSVMLGQGAP